MVHVLDQIESHVKQGIGGVYGYGSHPTVIVLAPLSGEMHIQGDLQNTKQRGIKTSMIIAI